MPEAYLLPHLIDVAAERAPSSLALTVGRQNLSYSELQRTEHQFADGLASLALRAGARVAVYLEKRLETVVACFGTAAFGGTFVPVNPLLKAEQVGFILRDCDVQVLVTSPERLQLLEVELQQCPAVHTVVVTDVSPDSRSLTWRGRCIAWAEFMVARPGRRHRRIDSDMLAILYTSGSTGRPKGVVLSHRNMVAGAKSVASYLNNRADDVLLAALPLSFDAGFSQLTTAFHAGARVVLLNYLMPADVLKALVRERVTGITAVPPLYMQLTQVDWPPEIDGHLRYFANTGGRLPRETLNALRLRVPRAEPFLMYGLTEAFRSTYLPPEEVDRRADSIGRAIPNAEIVVLREDGSECDVDEPGELVHRGALVGMGYWNDADRTAERYRPMPGLPGGLQLPEYAVFSGDTVRRDADGFLYFVGRRDEMIKTSGYRVSPTEVEEILYATRLVGECVAFGVEHSTLGQAIQVVATPPSGAATLDVVALSAECRRRMPAYMVPAGFEVVTGPLPRNPNGKIDRKWLAAAWSERHLT